MRWLSTHYSFPAPHFTKKRTTLDLSLELNRQGTDEGKTMSEGESRSVMSGSATPWTLQSAGFSRPEHWSGQPFPSPGDLPNPWTEPRSPALQADSLPAEPLGKSKNPGMGSLSLLQWIFPNQESNLSLLHCRQILYQLSYEGSHSFLNIEAIAFSNIEKERQ